MNEEDPKRMILQLMEEMQQQMAEMIGDPVYPSAKRAHQEWKEAVLRLRKEEFMFTIPLKTMGFSREANTDTFFGQHLINVPAFLQRVHPDFLEPYLRWGRQAYMLALSPQMAPKIKSFRFMYRILIPLAFRIPSLSESRSVYYWVVQTARPFRLDHQDQICEQINLYRVLKKYEPGDLSAFKAEIISDDGLVTEEETRSLLFRLCDSLLDELGPDARRIMTSYLDGAKRSADVATETGLPLSRISTVQKKILRCANEWYPWKKFTMAKQFAQFLKEAQD